MKIWTIRITMIVPWRKSLGKKEFLVHTPCFGVFLLLIVFGPPVLFFSIKCSKNDSNPKESLRQARDVSSGTESKTKLIEPPHLCTQKRDNAGHPYIDRCHVYTNDTKSLTVNVTIRSATNVENITHSADWCNYPLGELLFDSMT